jgi:hypothetical protein
MRQLRIPPDHHLQMTVGMNELYLWSRQVNQPSLTRRVSGVHAFVIGRWSTIRLLLPFQEPGVIVAESLAAIRGWQQACI